MKMKIKEGYRLPGRKEGGMRGVGPDKN